MSLRKIRLSLILLSIIILAVVIISSNPLRLLSILSTSDLNYILVAFIFSNIAIFLRIAKWNVLLDNVRFYDVVPVQLLGVTISNFSPGKIAEPAKALILKMKTKISVSESLKSIVWERLLDIIILLFLAFFVLQILAVPGRFLFLSIMSIIAFLFLVFLLLIVLTKKAVAYRLFYFLKKLPIINRVDDAFIEIFYQQKIKTERLVISLVLTLLAWLFDGFVFYFAFRSVGIEMNPFILAGLIALATLVGIVSFLPGGIGSMEISMLFLLNIQGIDSALALTGILLSRSLSIWYVTLLGGLSFLYMGKKLDIKNILH